MPKFHSKETKDKMRLTAIRNGNHPVHNKPHTIEVKLKINEHRKGIKAWNYIEDRYLLKDDSKERGGQLHRDWSKSVKKRDGWKCRIAGENCGGRIEAHHILGWSNFPELRYKINNGITLCHAHHPRKRAEEKRLVSEFLRLVSVSN